MEGQRRSGTPETTSALAELRAIKALRSAIQRRRVERSFEIAGFRYARPRLAARSVRRSTKYRCERMSMFRCCSVILVVFRVLLAWAGVAATSSAQSFHEEHPPWSGGTEHILVQPPQTPGSNQPLLVMFHGHYEDHWWDNPNHVGARNALFAEAESRNWYAVTFDGGDAAEAWGTYGGVDLHPRAEAVIDHMISSYGIDRDRIYGFGFSMGGGDVLNYAARHLDRDGSGGMMAAVWSRSGTVSIREVWIGGGSNWRQYIQGLLGVPRGPDILPFPYAKASVLHTQNAAPYYANDLCLAHNLAHIPVSVTKVAGDIAHVQWATEVLEDFALDMGYGFDFDLDLLGGHNEWVGFSAFDVCDYLDDGDLANYPSSAQKTVAATEGRYFHFAVQRTDPDWVAPFQWAVVTSQNRVNVLQASNLMSIMALLLDMGLNPAVAVNLTVQVTNGCDVVLDGYTTKPSVVAANWGGPLWLIIDEGAGWTWDGANGRVILDQNSSSTTNWRVTP